MCVYVSVCDFVYVCVNVIEGQNRVLDCLKKVWQAVLRSLTWMLGTELRTASSLNSWAISIIYMNIFKNVIYLTKIYKMKIPKQVSTCYSNHFLLVYKMTQWLLPLSLSRVQPQEHIQFGERAAYWTLISDLHTHTVTYTPPLLYTKSKQTYK